MATSKNTIKVPVNFGNVADVADAVLTTLGTPTVYIAENSVTNPVTFSDVCLFLTYQDVSTATGATITETRAACTLAGASAATITELDDLTHTAENKGGVIGPFNFTSHFTSNFGTGASKACQVDAYFDHSTGTGLDARAVYGCFEINYEYNTAEASRSKTICIPYESPTGLLTTTANTAFLTIPQLTGVGGLLEGYASPTIRHVWAEVRGNNGCNGTTNFNLNYSFDGSGSNALPTIVTNLNSPTYNTYLIDLSSLSTTASHTLDLWSSLASRFPNLTVDIYVTFDYTVSGTTTVLVNTEYSAELISIGNDYSRWSKPTRIMVPEGTTSLKYAACEFFFMTRDASVVVSIKAGSQATPRAYTFASSGVICGMQSLQHRLDSGSGAGAAFTLSRGENSIPIDIKSGNVISVCTNTSMKIKMLYSVTLSGSETVDNVSKTIKSMLRQIDFGFSSNAYIDDAGVVAIPETSYWLMDCGIDYYQWSSVSTQGSWVVRVEVLGGEGKGDGYIEVYADSQVNDNELSYMRTAVSIEEVMKKHPGDPRSRLDLETSRNYRTTPHFGLNHWRYGACLYATYHSLTYTLSGEIKGSAGGTVNIYVHRSDTGEIIYSTSRSGNGSYSVSVYDPVLSVYVTASEDATHKGRSKTAAAGSGFDIALSSGMRTYVG